MRRPSRSPRPRRERRPGPLAVLLAALLALVTVPGTLAGWDDPSTADAPGLVSVSLASPSLSCSNTSATSVTISWTAQTSPTTLDYAASIAGVPLTVTNAGGSQRQVVVTGSLLSALLGGVKTVSVTGSLPGTAWTSSTSTTGVLFTLVGLLVSCV